MCDFLDSCGGCKSLGLRFQMACSRSLRFHRLQIRRRLCTLRSPMLLETIIYLLLFYLVVLGGQLICLDDFGCVTSFDSCGGCKSLGLRFQMARSRSLRFHRLQIRRRLCTLRSPMLLETIIFIFSIFLFGGFWWPVDFFK